MKEKMKCILYGAGNHAMTIYTFLEYKGWEDVVEAFCDRNASSIGNKNGKPVFTLSEIKDKGLPIVIAVDRSGKPFQEIKACLENEGIEYYDSIFDYLKLISGITLTEVYRDYCGFVHVSSMDEYFNDAESDDSISIFWGEDSAFFEMFKKLDLTNVIELACGRGRHVPRYYNKAGHVVLVDILDKNIQYCKKRFYDLTNIDYYCNNGFDLSELKDNEYTSLFSYDAVVHFELLDVFNYLKETHRVLKRGGMALIHHSNDDSNYRNWVGGATNHGGRSYMSKDLFAYLAYRSGFEIIEQHVIDWGDPELDCISLIKKSGVMFYD